MTTEEHNEQLAIAESIKNSVRDLLLNVPEPLTSEQLRWLERFLVERKS